MTATALDELARQFSKDLKIQRLHFLDKFDATDDHANALNTATPVDYELMQDYVDHLAKTDPFLLKSDEAKLSFWINIYNGFTNFLIVKNAIKSSMKHNPTVYFLPKLTVGRHRFSLDDIEHGILRCNRRAGKKLFRQFGRGDARLNLLPEKRDYRIHFALNCGAQSCPPLAFYSVEGVDGELTLAERSFVEQEFLVDHNTKSILCSRLFLKYKHDFRNVYVNDPQYQEYKIRYRRYNWNVLRD